MLEEEFSDACVYIIGFTGQDLQAFDDFKQSASMHSQFLGAEVFTMQTTIKKNLLVYSEKSMRKHKTRV